MFSEKKLFQALDPLVLLSEKIIVSNITFTNKTREWWNILLKLIGLINTTYIKYLKTVIQIEMCADKIDQG